MKITTCVDIRANNVTKLKNGTFRLEIEAEELAAEDRATLDRLYPHTLDRAHDLLNEELILKSIVPVNEMGLGVPVSDPDPIKKVKMPYDSDLEKKPKARVDHLDNPY